MRRARAMNEATNKAEVEEISEHVGDGDGSLSISNQATPSRTHISTLPPRA